MKIFYCVHITGTDAGLSGIPRVVRNLARALSQRRDVTLVPVRWQAELRALVHTEQKLLDNLSRNHGPEMSEAAEAGRPINPAPEDWLVIAEVPHLRSHYPDQFPSVHLDDIVGYNVQHGLKTAVIFHDILPLTFAPPGLLPQRRDDAGRLATARYAHAIALADLVLPVSRTAGEDLRNWLVQHGHRPQNLPAFAPILLPEEVLGQPCVAPEAQAATSIEFVALGLVNVQKNQMSVIKAFCDLLDRRPDLDLRLHLIGMIDETIAMPLTLLAKRRQGRVVLHGSLPEASVRALVYRARATIFLSLAEGYGLPVAESLWRGKPSLCSNVGSMAEIAQSGGCLAVDPRDIEAISQALETLATDESRYRALLQEIAARPLKTWALYSDEILSALSHPHERSSAPALPLPKRGSLWQKLCRRRSVPKRIKPQAAQAATFAILAGDWLIPAHYTAASRKRSLFYSGAIHYDAKHDRLAEEGTIVYGPYISLLAGSYTLTLEGVLDGELELCLTANDGKLQILNARIGSFAKPLSFCLKTDVARFELVVRRTDALKSLKLRGALFTYQAPSLSETP